MSVRHLHTDDESEVQLPQGLRDDLGHLYGSSMSVPAKVDEAILGLARRRLARHRRSRLVLRSLKVGAAAAAAIALVLLWTNPWRQPEPAESPAPVVVVTAGPNDIDGNGRVDILDAFALARRIEQGPRPAGEWDLNCDGAINDKDVDTVAMAAVSLKGGASL